MQKEINFIDAFFTATSAVTVTGLATLDTQNDFTFFGQIIIMNIYYFKKQSIDIPKFWFAILKMSISPSILGVISFFIIKAHRPDTITKLSFSILIFTIVYFIFFWFFSMNKYEKETLSKPILNFFNK